MTGVLLNCVLHYTYRRVKGGEETEQTHSCRFEELHCITISIIWHIIKNIVQRWMCEHWIPIANLLHKSLSEYSRLSIIQNLVVVTLWWRNKTLQNVFLRVSKLRGRVSQLRSLLQRVEFIVQKKLRNSVLDKRTNISN